MKQEKTLTQGAGSKRRIRLFDSTSHLMLSDRLVEQSTEMMKGPEEIHKGPISLEFNLYNQGEVDSMIDYVKKLRGVLPIEEKKKVGRKSKTVEKMLSDKEPLLDIIKLIKSKCKTQEDVVKTLREYDFMFVDHWTIQDVAKPDMITLREKDLEKDYQYMVRRIKEAKDPANDKFDWRLTFGIKIVGERIGVVQIYLWGEHSEYLKIPWDDKNKINFKKVEKIYSFPEMMDYVERKKWRMENRKVLKALENNVAYEPSKFFNKWKPYVKVN